MKRKTALKNAKIIASRLKKVSGIVCTPDCHNTAYRIKKAWLFGSTAKGKENPNDVDILLEGFYAGQYQTTGKNAARDSGDRRGNSKKNRTICGIHLPKDSLYGVKEYLVGNLKMIRLHDFKIDGNYGDIAETKIMIYPKFMLED